MLTPNYHNHAIGLSAVACCWWHVHESHKLSHELWPVVLFACHLNYWWCKSPNCALFAAELELLFQSGYRSRRLPFRVIAQFVVQVPAVVVDPIRYHLLRFRPIFAVRFYHSNHLWCLDDATNCFAVDLQTRTNRHLSYRKMQCLRNANSSTNRKQTVVD